MGGTAVTSYPVSTTTLSLKWREQYASQALNRYGRATLGRGIVRGFRPEAGLTDRQLFLSPDPLTGDSVLLGAGPLTSDNEAPCYREVAPVALDLSTHMALGDVRYLAFILDYVPTVATTAQYRLYTQAEYDGGVIDADEGVVICKITAPGIAGPITDIDLTPRDDQWKWRHHGAQPEGEEVTLLNLQPHSDVDAYLLSGTGNGGINAAISTAFNAQLGTRALLWVANGSPDPGLATIPLLGPTQVRSEERLLLRARYRFETASGPPAAVFTFTFLTAAGTFISNATLALPVVAGDEYFAGQVQAPINAALVAVTLSLALYDILPAGAFTLSSLLITGQRAISGIAGAPDTVERRTVPLQHVANRILLVPSADADESVAIFATGGGEVEIRADENLPYAAVRFSPPTPSTPMDIYLNGVLYVGYINAVAADPTVMYAISDSTAGTRRVLWRHKDFAGAGNTGHLASYEGSMELTSGGMWNAGANRWDYDIAGVDLLRLSVDVDGVRVRSLDASQFPGVNATDANSTQPLFIPVLKRLATEDPVGKATPKLAFDVRSTALGANLILECQQGTAGQAHRLYEFGNGLSNSQVWETVNGRYVHATDQITVDTLAQSTLRLQTNQNHTWSITDPNMETSTWAAGVFNAAMTFSYGASGPDLALVKGGNVPSTASVRINGINQDLRIDFGNAADNTVSPTSPNSTNPAATVIVRNTLRAKGLDKFWGIIHLPVALATPEVLEDGYGGIVNVDNVASDRLLVTLASSMASSAFHVQVTHDETGGANAYACTWERVAANQFYIYLYPMGSGARANPATATGRINFTVKGVQ